MGIVLPESVFDTSENKYIRLFIYKYFVIKAIVSLPQVTFAPFTTTKTSILFAQKKTSRDIDKWNTVWQAKSNEYSRLKTKCENICAVADGKKKKEKLPSIKNLSEEQEKECLLSLLRSLIPERNKSLSLNEIIKIHRSEIDMICKIDKDTQNIFGAVNTWWVFGEVAQELSYPMFMAEAEHVGYKRTKRLEQKLRNDLYREAEGEVLVDDGKKETILDYLREINW